MAVGALVEIATSNPSKRLEALDSVGEEGVGLPRPEFWIVAFGVVVRQHPLQETLGELG